VLNPPTTAGGAAVPTSTVNNNLGDISDWLTKTLVGVGLTQLYSLPKFLGDIAADANSYGFQWGDYGQLLAFSILLYFFNGGFWLGYFGTRTFITILFGQFASGLPKSSIALAGQPLKLALDSANNFAPAPPELRVVDAALLSVPLQSLSSRDEVMAWAAAQARAQNPNAARAALENVLACDPGNQDAMRQLVKVYLALGQYGDAVRLGKALTEDTAPKMVAALYDFAPGGFREAQRIGLKLMQDKDAEEGPTIHVWLACAYAQEFGWLKKQQPNDAAKIATAHDNAMAQIQRTLELDPTVRDQLHAFWKPADPNTMDNDLAVFGDDPELKKLLEPDIDPPAPAPSQDVQPVAPPPTPQAPKPDPAPEPGEPK
ncbi:MAG TPA: tetratricopeptide repeat protein, partial [Rhizomicrobium sp.]